ncbi:MAG: rRNA maturation RNase YbeY [Candidatus Magasanikbacteria bacterium]|nr:rRNA maturation RNase YbeY [Candidatus Magasanikbacteria bacterium]
MNKVLVSSLKPRFKSGEKYLKSVASKILRVLKKDNFVLEINLTDQGTMRKVNKRYRGADKPTNVLSFQESPNFPHPESKLNYLGEIYLCPDHIKKEARVNGITSYQLLIESLLVHGVLHLLGYTHKNENDRIKMEQQERRLLKFLMTNS